MSALLLLNIGATDGIQVFINTVNKQTLYCLGKRSPGWEDNENEIRNYKNPTDRQMLNQILLVSTVVYLQGQVPGDASSKYRNSIFQFKIPLTLFAVSNSKLRKCLKIEH